MLLILLLSDFQVFHFKLYCLEKCQRDTQTVLSCDKKLNAVSSEKNVQVFMHSHMIPCLHDKIIVSRKYVPAEQIRDSKELEHKVVFKIFLLFPSK